MKRNRFFTVVVAGAAIVLITSLAYALQATQGGKSSQEQKQAKCCASAPEKTCCGKQQQEKCCAADARKPCCAAGSGAKCRLGKSPKGCCSRGSHHDSATQGGCCAKKAPSKCCAAAGKGKCGLRTGACPAKPAQSAASSSKKANKDAAAKWAKAVARLKKIGYTDKDIAFLPPGAVLASAGAKNVVAYARLKPGETVVDLGCGGGIDCLLAARLVGSSGKVIGVDMSPKAIATARKNLCEVGLKNVEFRKGRLQKLPLEDASVDVAISNCVGIVMRGDAVVLSEAVRVLKPGGRLVTTGRLSDEFRAKLRAAGFTTIERPAEHMIVATKGK